MTPAKSLSPQEAAVLDAALPEGLTESMRELAWCLFEALALREPQAGQAQPAGAWLERLHALAEAVAAQVRHVAAELGGRPIYLARGVAVGLSARDRQMCAKFRGNNYRQLASEYGLTEMRVRQIVDAWQREQFAQRQGRLPGLDDEPDGREN